LPEESSDGASGQGRERLFSALLLVAAISFLVICRRYGLDSTHRWFGRVPVERPADLLLLPVAALAAMLLHETGHLLASLLLGFEVLGGSVGPLNIQILRRDWKLSWSLRTFFTGSISAVPRSLNHWRRAMMVVIAAGPLATLAGVLAVLPLSPVNHSWLVLQIAFVQVSVLLFLLGFIPNGRAARQQNDARLFVDLARRNAGADEMELKVWLKQQMLAGSRPEDYSAALRQRLAGFRGRPASQLLFTQALVEWAIDSEQIQAADRWDRQALALSGQCDKRLRNAALASSACFDVIFRADLDSARVKFARVNLNALFPTCFRERAAAAQQMTMGEWQRVGAHIIRAQYALPRGAGCELERSLIEKLHLAVLAAAAVRPAQFSSASA
jgi:hypothetical protein